MSEKDDRGAEPKDPRGQPLAQDDADETERRVARSVAWGVPVASVLAAIAVGVLLGVGPAILVLAAGALVGVIGLLWASLRTLGGDAPLAEGLAAAAASRETMTDAGERKRRVLRALKDLELEHQVGKIDDADYAQISARYRDQAKAILREMDVAIEPLRAKAEEIAARHLKKRGLVEGSAPAPASEPALDDRDARPSAVTTRVACLKCATSNEPDAEFCKKCGTRLRDAAEASDGAS